MRITSGSPKESFGQPDHFSFEQRLSCNTVILKIADISSSSYLCNILIYIFYSLMNDILIKKNNL